MGAVRCHTFATPEGPAYKARMLRWLLATLSLFAVSIVSCGDDGEGNGMVFDVAVSEPRFVVPSETLPPQIRPMASNNNVDIAFHEGRLFMAWRSAPTHFASAEARMFIVSSPDNGATWEFEHALHLGNDLREPRLLSFNGFLQMIFFEGGTNPARFEPRRMLRVRRLAPAVWSDVEVLSERGEVPWDIKVRGGIAYLTSYFGNHNPGPQPGDLRLVFSRSLDGTVWEPVDGVPYVYRGGVSEAAFEFEPDGSLYAVTRNEDGDDTGFGSHVCFAPANALSQWDCPDRAHPERYDSPELFRHENELYLAARRDVGGPYDEGLADLSFGERKVRYLIDYSRRPKRTAIYRLDRRTRSIVHVIDLPSAGDTAYPSVQRTGPHTFLLANYTSPLDNPDISWLEGQTSERGTQIYLLTLTFVPRALGAPSPTLAPTFTRVPTVTPTPGGPAPIRLSPVFAPPNEPLSIEWPPEASGALDLGDGTVVGPEVRSHRYGAEDAIYRIQGTVNGSAVSGFVARTGVLASTPLRGFRLVEPPDPVAAGVLPPVIPAFYWALASNGLAVGTDAAAQRNIEFTRVARGELTVEPDGSFRSAPMSLTIELTGLDRTPSGVFVRLVGTVFRSRVEGATLASPMAMDAQIFVADVVNALRTLGGFEEKVAVQFVAAVFGFDPDHPPQTVPFRGEMKLEPF